MNFDATYTIKGVQSEAPEYYVKAFFNHIKEIIEQELNAAPDSIIESYDRVEAYGKVIE